MKSLIKKVLLCLAISSITACGTLDTITDKNGKTVEPFQQIDKENLPTFNKVLSNEIMKKSIKGTAIYLRFSGKMGEKINLSLPTPDGQENVVRPATGILTKRSDDSFSWVGSFDDDKNSTITIVSEKGFVSGVIFSSDGQYAIKALKKDIAIITKINPRAFPPDHGPDYRSPNSKPEEDLCDLESEAAENNCYEKLGEQHSLGLRSGVSGCSQPVDVLVLVTPAAEAVVGNSSTTAQLAIDISNQSFANSNAAINFSLVGVEPISYTEVDYQSDLDALIDPSDGIIDNVHNLRNQYSADLVIMLTNEPTICGIAGDIHATKERGFATVAIGCAVDNLSFPHEIGHLIGARHNTQADSSNVPFKYGHGRYRAWKNYRTVMSYNCPSGNCVRVPYWSNPDVKYKNRKTGDYTRRHNARVLNEQTCRVAGFYETSPFQTSSTNGDYWFKSNTPKSTPVSGDFDNDGHLDDIVYYGKCGNSGSDCWRGHIGNGTNFTTTNMGANMWFASNSLASKPVSGDFDNDGHLDDIVYYGKCGNSGNDCWRGHIGNGTNFTTTNMGADMWFAGSSITSAPMAGDFDNDGFVDDLAYYGKCGNAGNNCWRVHLSNGSTFTATSMGGDMWFSGNGPNHRPISGDFDDDGFKDDIAYYGKCGSGGPCWRVHLGNGSSFSAANYGENAWFKANVLPHSSIALDANNDGFYNEVIYAGLCGSGNDCWRSHTYEP